jgi:NADH-quinone oxidoreductase subunit E
VVAGLLDMAPIRVYEVGTFYTMFNLKPIGRYNLQVCTTTPCWLRGSDDVVAACFKTTGIAHWGGTSADGLFTMTEVECLGACSNAPMIQINDDYYEDLDGPRTEALLEALRHGETPTPGSTIGRQGSMAEGGPTTLTDTAALWSPEKYAALQRERAETEARAAAAAAANPPPPEPEPGKMGA